DRAAQRTAAARLAFFAVSASPEDGQQRPSYADWLGEVWQTASCPSESDPALRDGLRAAAVERPRDATLLNALAVATLEAGRRQLEPVIQATLTFQEAWAADPRHAVAG